jgi:ATP-dependent DNA helicase RecG
MVNIGFKEDLVNEFKSDRNCLPDGDIIDAVVAFSNTNGGDLYLGVENNGEITGLHPKHRDITQLAAFIANKTVPPVSVRAEVIGSDIQVLKISVPRRTTIVASSEGKIQRRRLKANGEPENVPMYPYEISTRLSSLGLLDYSAQPVMEATYEDLDPLERERLRNIIRSCRGETALLELSDEELDKALQLVSVQNGKLVPTFCGLLLIGRKEALKHYMPTAESSVQVLAGTGIKVNESFFLPILAAFEKIVGVFSAWNASTEMNMGLYRINIPDCDPRAFREGLVNAFCHRDYSVLGRVLVQMNDEGISISNPGGFIEGIHAENLLDVEPRGRNPVLSDALKRIGLAERTGRGIDRIYEGSLLYGRLLPDYDQSSSVGIKLFLPKGPVDKAFIRLVSQEQQNLGRSLPVYSLLVLNAIKELHRPTIEDIANQVHAKQSRVRVVLENLLDSGLIVRIGSSRNCHYIMSSKYVRQENDESGYVMERNTDTVQYRELVLQFAQEKGEVTRSDVIDLLNVNPAQAYRILQKLKKSGHLTLNGKGAGAKYHP